MQNFGKGLGEGQPRQGQKSTAFFCDNFWRHVFFQWPIRSKLAVVFVRRRPWPQCPWHSNTWLTHFSWKFSVFVFVFVFLCVFVIVIWCMCDAGCGRRAPDIASDIATHGEIPSLLSLTQQLPKNWVISVGWGGGGVSCCKFRKTNKPACNSTFYESYRLISPLNLHRVVLLNILAEEYEYKIGQCLCKWIGEKACKSIPTNLS